LFEPKLQRIDEKSLLSWKEKVVPETVLAHQSELHFFQSTQTETQFASFIHCFQLIDLIWFGFTLSLSFFYLISAFVDERLTPLLSFWLKVLLIPQVFMVWLFTIKY